MINHMRSRQRKDCRLSGRRPVAISVFEALKVARARFPAQGLECRCERFEALKMPR